MDNGIPVIATSDSTPQQLAPGISGEQPELSILMPCLNEAETLATCIRKAQSAMTRNAIHGEVVIADNGSTDGSQEIARSLGARVVDVAEKGYGNALRGGIAASRGRFIIMGDSDDSYDFSTIEPFIEKLRAGFDLVMGNRFAGGISPGAMPWKHRWIGNPVLTTIGRLFFHAPAGDFHCGLRGFSRDAYQRMGLRTIGMEFASEMVIKASLERMRVTEVPIILHKDGRSRPPHLRSWRDGWRHLRFMLLFSPRWLFLYPGALLLMVGLALGGMLTLGPLTVGHAVLDIHTLLLCGFVALLGQQLVIFAVFTKIFAITEGFHPPNTALRSFLRFSTLEAGLVFGVLLSLIGVVLLIAATWSWRAASFGALDPRHTMRQVIPAVVLMALGMQTIFGSFFLSILGLGRK
jgi:glycosyltransferase involved in cell wall biosynthesis